MLQQAGLDQVAGAFELGALARLRDYSSPCRADRPAVALPSRKLAVASRAPMALRSAALNSSAIARIMAAPAHAFDRPDHNFGPTVGVRHSGHARAACKTIARIAGAPARRASPITPGETPMAKLTRKLLDWHRRRQHHASAPWASSPVTCGMPRTKEPPTRKRSGARCRQCHRRHGGRGGLSFRRRPQGIRAFAFIAASP